MSRNGARITAVVLNYARLENVKTIVAHLCSEQLRDTISCVIVWNNNVHRPVSGQDFESDLPEGMLKVFNAPENSYFQARFLACMEAPTEWCLVQDDDYLVSAEAIRALWLYSRLKQPDNQHPIHLLPPHEHLSTTLRTRSTDSYTASFAWLGHGTLLRRTHARSFINLLRILSENKDDVMKMADNFFSILLNRRAEAWIDPGMHFEAGQDKAFTVGDEGDERNWYYILRNIWSAIPLNDSQLITRAPVLAPGCVGVWSTNIQLLPPGTLEAGSAGSDLRSVDQLRRAAMADVDFERYIQNNLACIGDGLESTVFRSPRGCEEGQWLQFDFIQDQIVSSVALEWSAEAGFAPELRQISYEILVDDQGWTKRAPKKVEPAYGNMFMVSLDLDRPSSSIAVRAVVGPGSAARPPWAVVGCIVRAA
ncbi:glycosyltransferase family 64 protein [Ceratobasidium sp. AG-Ba]|nr:glycosyltransferase family 64 protein [Ceratobasidium sp. AG-Ba]QRW04170.1 glycosyltransferase family 64 protein [Ceratobasidium sp. AG-Ba]